MRILVEIAYQGNQFLGFQIQQQGRTVQQQFEKILKRIQHADTLIVLGSSLVVQPAAGFVSEFKGDNLVIINRDATPYDHTASLVIHDDMTSVIEEIVNSNS